MKAPRLLVHVEGQTEEEFVNEILAPHLHGHGWAAVSARLMGHARSRRRRGGVPAWPVARQDLCDHLRADSGVTATTMVDFYGMPATGPGAWPSRDGSRSAEVVADAVEIGMARAVSTELGSGFQADRFVPFVLLHEFEALLFSDPGAFARGIGHAMLAGQFTSIREQFATPEEINDSPLTAPSKRILQILPAYEKPLLGPLAVLEIGLPRIAAECPRFAKWLARLEQLGAARG